MQRLHELENIEKNIKILKGKGMKCFVSTRNVLVPKTIS